MRPAPPVALLAALASCATQEEIDRRGRVDLALAQVRENQGLLARSLSRTQAVEERLAAMTGRLDEVRHDSETTLDQRLAGLEARVEALEESGRAVRKDLEEQSGYLRRVIGTLEKMGRKRAPSSSPYDQAMADYRRGRYKTAKNRLLAILEGGGVKGSRRARVLHNLGMIAHMDEDDERALVYFSKLFTEQPGSSYNKNGLLFLAKSFGRLGREDRMRSALEELVSRFPKAKQAPEARRLLAGAP